MKTIYCVIAQPFREMPRKTHRVKSDLLYRLCKSVSDSVYPNLKALNDSRAPGSQQWKLFEYYRSLNEWSRDIEKTDWPSAALADLKYRTLKWFIRSMNKLGDWPNSEIHSLIGDIAWSIDHNVGEAVFQLIDDAKIIASETELYSLLQVILDYDRRATLLLTQGKERQNRLNRIVKESREVQNVIEEELKIFDLRAKFFDPYIDDVKIKGEIQLSNAEALFEQLKLVPSAGFKSGAAKIEYLTLQIWCSLVLQDFNAAKQAATQVQELESQRPWLASNDPGRHLQINWLRLGAFVVTGEKVAAEKTLQLFEIKMHENNSHNLNRVIYRIWSLFLLYEQFGEESTRNNAISLFKEYAEVIWMLPFSKMQVWPTFFAAKATLDIQDYDFALKTTHWILSNKKHIGERMLANARIFELICFVGKRGDFEMIRGASIAVQQFLVRHPEQPAVYGVIARAIGSVSKLMQESSPSIGNTVEFALRDVEAAFIDARMKPERFVGWLKSSWSNAIGN